MTRPRHLRLFLLAALAATLACSGETADDTAPAVRAGSAATSAIRADDPEARAWIAPGDARVTLAPDWFDSLTDASQFIERLYAAGAERVVVASESIRREDDGFMRADALRVQLPREPAVRARVFAVLDAEAQASERGRVTDTGQAVHQMSWD